MRVLLGFVSFFMFQLAFGAKITGNFVGSPAGDRFTLRVNTMYIDGIAQNYELNTGNLGQFSVEFTLREPQYITLQHNSEILILFVEPDDNLDILGDVFQFPHTVQFAGQGAGNNRCLQAFMRANPINFNEFTKTRYKIANYWATIDPDIDEQMRKKDPSNFSAFLDTRMNAHLKFIDNYEAQHPESLSNMYKQFMTTEIMYRSGFEAVVYANVYKNWHNITDTWLEGILQLPLDGEMIGSESYRRYIMVYLAHRCKKAGKVDRAIETQFLDGGETLTYKPRAFFQSEIICNGLKEEHYDEVLPYYSAFLKENGLDDYEQKITDLYEKKVAFAPGVLAPPYSGLDADGTRITDKTLRNGIVYLNFWASYCGTCIKKIEYVNSQYGTLRDHGVHVINVSLDPNSEVWHANIVRHRVLGYNFLNEVNGTTNFVKDFKVEAVPSYFIIDKNGSFVQKPSSSKPEDIVKFLIQLGSKQ